MSTLNPQVPRRRLTDLGPSFRGFWLRGAPYSLAALLICLVAIRVADLETVQTLRFETFDFMQRMAPRDLSTDAVVIVDIDESSLETFGQWPWSRVDIARMVETLVAAGAVTIGFDMLFSEPDRLSPTEFARGRSDLPSAIRAFLAQMPSNEEQLADVLQRSRVVLGMSAIDDAGSFSQRSPGRQTPVLQKGGNAGAFLYRFPMALRNLERLEAASSGQGVFVLTPEVDGIVRRVPAAVVVGDQVLPSLAIEMLRVAQGREHYSITVNPQGAGIEFAKVGALTVPTDVNGRIWHRFSRHDPSIYLSAADLLSGRFNPDLVRNKLVLVGTSAVGLRDLRATPLEGSIPGVEVHAQILDSVIAGDLLIRPPYALGVELGIALFVCGLMVVFIPRLGALSGFACIALVVVGLVGGAYLLFQFRNLVFDPTFPALAATVTFIHLTIGNYARSDRQKRQIRTAFSHYLSPDLVRQITDRPELLRLGGESRELTFVFTDVAGFTRFTEQNDPVLLVELLNRYLDRVCQIVLDHGGTVDKIVGDAVHAMFGAPLEQPDHADRAVRCALEIDAFAQSFYAEQKAKGHDFGATRVGVNTGPAVVGNFGGESRFDYTAHGDSINTAARMEQANKDLGTRICVSQSTMDSCSGQSFRPIGRLRLRGKENAVQVFEPLAETPIDSVAHRDYCEAYRLMDGGDSAARAAFDDLASRFPNDPLVALHVRRLGAGAVSGELTTAGA